MFGETKVKSTKSTSFYVPNRHTSEVKFVDFCCNPKFDTDTD